MNLVENILIHLNCFVILACLASVFLDLQFEHVNEMKVFNA